MFCFGVDLGGTTVKIGLFNQTGDVIEKWEIKTRTENGGENILPDIAQSLKEKLKKHHIEKKEIIGIGMGVPAPVSEDGVVQKTANLGWGYKEVRRELEELTGYKVKIGNDANVAALGEMWKGGGVGHKNMVMVTLGTGVGGGIIIDGQVVVGANGAGGEIGHLKVNSKESERCGCGGKGCLEQYASATGIARLAKCKLAKMESTGDHRKTVLNRRTISAKKVFDAVKVGDKVAIEIAEEFGTYLGHALANISVLIDPSVYVIGGGVSRAGEVLLDFIRVPYMEKAFFANKDVTFALATLGNDAGIYGAAKMVL